MAKSTKEYFDVIKAEKETMTDLNGWLADTTGADSFLEKIDNKSKVSYWERLAWVMAKCANVLDDMLDFFKIDLAAIAKRSQFGPDFYVDTAKAYQHGDNLVKINKEWKYPDTPPVQLAAKKIIAFAALTETGDALTLKVAQSVGGVQQAIDSAQLQAFSAYMSILKPSGIDLTCVSLAPDLMWLQLLVNYDPTLLKGNGESIASPGTFPVEEAINAYLLSINKGFKGRFENDKMIDFVQAARGVTSAYSSSSKGKPNAGAYGAAFLQSYVAAAGYMKIDPANSLAANITYTPEA